MFTKSLKSNKRFYFIVLYVEIESMLASVLFGFLTNKRRNDPILRQQILNNQRPYLNPSGLWISGFSGNVPKCSRILPVNGMNIISERKAKQFKHPLTDAPHDGWKNSTPYEYVIDPTPVVVIAKIVSKKITEAKFNFSWKKPSGMQQRIAKTVSKNSVLFLDLQINSGTYGFNKDPKLAPSESPSNALLALIES